MVDICGIIMQKSERVILMLNRDKIIQYSKDKNITYKKAEEIVEVLSKQYKFNHLPEDIVFYCYEIYYNALPDWMKQKFLERNALGLLCTKDNKIVTTYAKHLIVTDYGIYIETSDKEVNSNWILYPGQEWRTKDKYKNNVKYLIYGIKGCPEVKITHQLKPSAFEGLEPGKFYVSPNRVFSA